MKFGLSFLSGSNPKADYVYPILLALWTALLFVPALGAKDFWNPGEPIYAEIIREMFHKGEWVVPTVNGELYTDKPVLYLWLALAFSHIAGGVSEWTVRLPAALGGIGLVITTYQFGKFFFDRQVGLLAAVVLATANRIVWESTFTRLDTVLSFFLLLGFYCFLRPFLGKGPRYYYFVAYLCFGLATLTKGLIGLVLPGLTIFCLILINNRWRELKAMQPLAGIFIIALVLGPWLLLLHLNGQDQWLTDFILIHHVQNYALEPLGHRRSFFYYFSTLPADFLPWTIFLPGALLYYYPWRDRLRDPATQALFCWFAVVFVFFTFSKSKIAYYILPLLPCLAIFTGSYMKELFAHKLEGVHARLTLILACLLAGLLLIGAIALPFASRVLEPNFLSRSVALACLAGVAGIALVRALKQSDLERFFWDLTVTLTVLSLAAALIVYPYLNLYKSPRPLAEFILRNISPAEPVYVFQGIMSDFNYYSQRATIPVIGSIEQAEKIASQTKRAYMLIRDDDLKQLDPRGERPKVAEGRLGNKKWYIIVWS